MRRRRFSRREEELVDQMIQGICQEISLPDAYDDEARSIGWCAFLSVYHRNPSCFLWSGAAGWTQVYREIHQELSAFQTQTSAQYHTPSLDRPVGPENDTPRIQLLQCPHGDFGPYICLKDYLRHLPERERWLARTLNSGYSLKEIEVLFRCGREELMQTHRCLQESMRRYQEI